MSALLAAYRRRRFAWLFGSLLLTLGAGPTLDALTPPGFNALQLLLGVNLLAAVASVAREGRMRVPLLLAFGFATARILRAALGIPAMVAVADVLWITAVVLAMVTSLRHAFSPGPVDVERILAALDAYLLAGLLFGVAYWMLDRSWPASFGGTLPGALDLPRAIYFSFVTIATLGYGDVVPVSEPARGLALVEAVSGQMYLAVLVARLVSVFAQRRD
jgi:hypothetical protein